MHWRLGFRAPGLRSASRLIHFSSQQYSDLLGISILCANRDEFLSRPTAEAHFHNFGDKSESDVLKGNVLSGRDLQAGGTWVGMNRSGRVALWYVQISSKVQRSASFYYIARTSRNPPVNLTLQGDISFRHISFQILQVLSRTMSKNLIVKRSNTLGSISSCYPLLHTLRVYHSKLPWSPTTAAGALSNPVCSLQRKGDAEGWPMGWTVKVETNGQK